MTPEETDYVNKTAESLSDALIEGCRRQRQEPVMALNIGISNVLMLAIKLRQADVDPRDAMRYAATLVARTVETTLEAMEADPEVLEIVLEQHRERREALGSATKPGGLGAHADEFPEVEGFA